MSDLTNLAYGLLGEYSVVLLAFVRLLVGESGVLIAFAFSIPN